MAKRCFIGCFTKYSTAKTNFFSCRNKQRIICSINIYSMFYRNRISELKCRLHVVAAWCSSTPTPTACSSSPPPWTAASGCGTCAPASVCASCRATTAPSPLSPSALTAAPWSGPPAARQHDADKQRVFIAVRFWYIFNSRGLIASRLVFVS